MRRVTQRSKTYAGSQLATRRPRRAFLLVMVLIVVSMASMAALNFSNSMLTSHESTVFSGAQLQARMCAESGIQATRLFAAYDRLTRLDLGGYWDNPAVFQAMNVMPDSDPKKRGNFTLVAPSLDQTGMFLGLRFGLQNESAKLNLNTLAQLDQLSSSGALASAAMGGGGQDLSSLGLGGAGQGGGGQGGGQGTGGQGAAGQGAAGQNSQNGSAQRSGSGQSQSAGAGAAFGGGTGLSQLASQVGGMAGANLAQQLLMKLPGMTEEIADAILDWLDEDDEPRALGAEFADYYQQMQPPYKPTNGPLQSIEQLLLVRGVTPQHLYGYDENRNGVLDNDEQTKLTLGITPGLAPGQLAPVQTDPNVLPPPPLGWAPYLTLHSAEKNVANDGLARINVNSQDLQTLYQDLLDAGLNETYASFIVAYRLAGQPTASAANPLMLLINAAGASNPGGAMGTQLSPQSSIQFREPPISSDAYLRGARVQLAGLLQISPLRLSNQFMFAYLQQRGGGGARGGNQNGGQGGGNFGPGTGGGNRGGGQGGGQGGGNFGPGAGGGNRGGGQGGGNFGPGAGGGNRGGGQGNFGPGAGGRGQGGPGGPGGRGGPGGPGGPGQGGRGGPGGDGPRGDGPGGRGGPGGPGEGREGGGRGGRQGGLLSANGQGGQGGQGGQNQSPPQPWSAAALSSFDLTQQGGVQLNQLLDLVDATVTVNQNGQQVVYTSPFSSSPVDLALYSPIIMDKLTTVDAPALPGRINIMECPREILLGLPGMTEEIGEKILEARIDGSQSDSRKFETWLAAEGYLTMDQMRALLPLVTCGGDVFKGQVIGYLEGNAAASRVEAIVSGAGKVPEVLFFRRLDHLGRGFDIPTLGQRYDAAINSGLAPL